jgi:hypothetical protein
VETGFGVYPTSRFLGHSSEPNCEFYYDLNSRLVVKSTTEIRPGQRITVGDFPRMLEEVEPSLTTNCLVKSGCAERVGQNGRKDDGHERLIVAKKVAQAMS